MEVLLFDDRSAVASDGCRIDVRNARGRRYDAAATVGPRLVTDLSHRPVQEV